MQYSCIKAGTFVSRPNRFIANVIVDGEVVVAHVKNTGRCRELLIEGATVYLEDYISRMGSRHLRYSLVAVLKGDLLINMDSQAPNVVVGEALRDGTISVAGMSKLDVVRAESVYGDSRFDFFVRDVDGREGYVEVKGVTLEDRGVVKFPDAPTERGVKHIRGLIQAKRNGYFAKVVFLVQMSTATYFTPNVDTHREFAEVLREAQSSGVEVSAYTCHTTCDTLSVQQSIEVRL